LFSLPDSVFSNSSKFDEASGRLAQVVMMQAADLRYLDHLSPLGS